MTHRTVGAAARPYRPPMAYDAIVAGLRDTVRGRGASTVGRSRSLDEIQAEHGAILDALRAGDGDRAGAAMRYHLRRTGDLLAAQYGGGATPG